MELHPQHIEKLGKKESVILPYGEYQALLEIMDDYEDLKDLREAKKAAKGEKGIPLEQAITQLGI